MGTTLHFIIAFYPQTDGQFERTIQTLEDMLWACVLDFNDSWVMHLTLVKFAYNNSFHTSIDIASYEALYGRKCRMPLCWDEVGKKKLEDVELIETISKKVKIMRERLKVTQDRQKSYANSRRRDLEFEVGNMIFLKVASWKRVIWFQKRGKLNTRYSRPFRILERIGLIAYHVELPRDLERMYDVFHVKKVYIRSVTRVGSSTSRA